MNWLAAAKTASTVIGILIISLAIIYVDVFVVIICATFLVLAVGWITYLIYTIYDEHG